MLIADAHFDVLMGYGRRLSASQKKSPQVVLGSTCGDNWSISFVLTDTGYLRGGTLVPKSMCIKATIGHGRGGIRATLYNARKGTRILHPKYFCILLMHYHVLTLVSRCLPPDFKRRR